MQIPSDTMIRKLLACPPGMYDISKCVAPEKAADLTNTIRYMLDHRIAWYHGIDFIFNDALTMFKKQTL